MPSSAPEPARRLIVVLGYSDGRQRELHPICAARLEHAARLAEEGDAVLLSGWSRRAGRLPEAELMRRAWPGPERALLSDPDARHHRAERGERGGARTRSSAPARSSSSRRRGTGRAPARSSGACFPGSS